MKKRTKRFIINYDDELQRSYIKRGRQEELRKIFEDVMRLRYAALRSCSFSVLLDTSASELNEMAKSFNGSHGNLYRELRRFTFSKNTHVCKTIKEAQNATKAEFDSRDVLPSLNLHAILKFSVLSQTEKDTISSAIDTLVNSAFSCIDIDNAQMILRKYARDDDYLSASTIYAGIYNSFLRLAEISLAYTVSWIRAELSSLDREFCCDHSSEIRTLNTRVFSLQNNICAEDRNREFSEVICDESARSPEDILCEKEKSLAIIDALSSLYESIQLRASEKVEKLRRQNDYRRLEYAEDQLMKINSLFKKLGGINATNTEFLSQLEEQDVSLVFRDFADVISSAAHSVRKKGQMTLKELMLD